VFAGAVAEKPAGWFMIRNRIRVVKRKIWNEKGAQ
jgi:hypothetical protein